MYELHILFFISLMALGLSSLSRQRSGLLYCGLFGFSGHQKVDLTKLKLGLWDNQSRGAHSTGIYGKAIFKKAVSAETFIKGYHKALESAADAYEVIGHTRYATMGAKDDVCAHPYQYGKVVGTHNGWTVNTEQICEKMDIEMPDVDSQLIYKLLEAKDYDFNTFGEHIGQMALAFVMDDKLHLYRRHNKPLFIGQCKEGIYYSSLESSLDMIGAENIIPVPPGELFIFHRGMLVGRRLPKRPAIEMPSNARPGDWRWSIHNSYQYVPMTTAEKEELEKKSKALVPFQQTSAKTTAPTATGAGTVSGTAGASIKKEATKPLTDNGEGEFMIKSKEMVYACEAAITSMSVAADLTDGAEVKLNIYDEFGMAVPCAVKTNYWSSVTYCADRSGSTRFMIPAEKLDEVVYFTIIDDMGIKWQTNSLIIGTGERCVISILLSLEKTEAMDEEAEETVTAEEAAERLEAMKESEADKKKGFEFTITDDDDQEETPARLSEAEEESEMRAYVIEKAIDRLSDMRDDIDNFQDNGWGYIKFLKQLKEEAERIQDLLLEIYEPVNEVE